MGEPSTGTPGPARPQSRGRLQARSQWAWEPIPAGDQQRPEAEARAAHTPKSTRSTLRVAEPTAGAERGPRLSGMRYEFELDLRPESPGLLQPRKLLTTMGSQVVLRIGSLQHRRK